MPRVARRLFIVSALTLASIMSVPAAIASPTGVTANSVYVLQVGGAAGIPFNATAAALQLTATNPDGGGFLTAYPCGSERPTASNVNFGPGQTRSNLAVVQLGEKGRVCLFSSIATDLVVDVSGWFASDSPWTAIRPARVIDTRVGAALSTSVAGGSTLRVPVSAALAVGAKAVAAALNVTAVDQRTAGYLTVYQCDSVVPATSNVNFAPSDATANLVLAPLLNGTTCIHSSTDVNIVVDVMGWTASQNAFRSIIPARLTDTRINLGGGRLEAGSTRKVRVGRAGSGSTAVVNVTAAESSTAGFLTVHPCDHPRPTTSNTNVTPPPASSNLAISAPDQQGDICVYGSVSTDLVVDLTGWLEPASGYHPVSPARLLDTRLVTTTVPAPGSFASVPSNFDTAEWLATGERIPASSSYEPSGNFRTFCGFSHLGYNDPIVYPGQAGASHLHMFFGNTAVDANSTYESLRSIGSGTCQGGPLNRTGYWFPALRNAAGKVVVPENFELYYKGNGTQANIQAIQTNPNGLRMIAGYDMANGSAIRGEWSCAGGGKSATLPNCGSGQQLKIELRFPMCWNGQSVDSSNHRSHMAYGTGGAGWFTSQGGCPASHPIHLPELTAFATYTADGNTSNWFLDSDRMPGMTHANGSTFHADWFGGWDNAIQETWTQECIREMRNCVWGELGNGTRLIDYSGTYNGPKLIDPPPR